VKKAKLKTRTAKPSAKKTPKVVRVQRTPKPVAVRKPRPPRHEPAQDEPMPPPVMPVPTATFIF